MWIVANVLLEGNGVRPADVIARWSQSPADRALAYGVWTIVSLPAIRALLVAPSSFFLRTLPVPRWQILLSLAGGLLLAELPWAYLWLRGGGLVAGVAHVAAALALTTLLLSRLARGIEGLAAVLVLLVLGSPAPSLVLLAVSLPAAALGARAVWLRAPEPRARPARTWIGSSPGTALAAALGLSLWRRAPAQLARSLGFTSLALLAGYSGILNHQPGADLFSWALATLAPSSLLTFASLVGPLLQAEVQLCWLPAVYGTPALTLRLARLAPLAASGAVLASLHALVLGTALGLPGESRVLLWGSELLAALLLAPLVLGVARWSLRGDGHDSGRFVLGAGAALVGTTSIIIWLGASGLWLWTAAAALAWLEPWMEKPSAWALRSWLER